MNTREIKIYNIINDNYENAIKMNDANVLEKNISIQVYSSLVTEVIEYNRFMQYEKIRIEELEQIDDTKLILSEENIFTIIEREKKRRIDLIKMYTNAGHKGRVEKEKQALVIIEELLLHKKNVPEEMEQRHSLDEIDIDSLTEGNENEE